MSSQSSHGGSDDPLALRPAGTDVQDQGPSLRGAIRGRIAAGHHVLEVGNPAGALVHDATPDERGRVRPRPTPVLVRPRSPRGLVGRQAELAAVLAALDAGLPVELHGRPGIGKTALLRQLAQHERTASFADGVVYVPARRQSHPDLQQLLFEAFYESDRICKPTAAEMRIALRDKQALLLFDDVELGQEEMEQLLDLAPRSGFVIASRERCVWIDGHSIHLQGLPVDDAVTLFGRAIERPLDAPLRSAAADLCARLTGHPLHVLHAAAIARERGIEPEGWTRDVKPESLITALLASIGDNERRALLALTALPRVPLRAPQISEIAEVSGIEPSLTALVRQGLVIAHPDSRYRLADGVSDRLRRTDDLKPWANRTITCVTAWAERHRRDPDVLRAESETLLSAQRQAAGARRWEEALRLGQVLEPALVLGARWGAWAIAVDQSLSAARTLGNRAAEAWALHELGTRAVCLGEPGAARGLLGQAVRFRQAMDDHEAAEASQQNLDVVLAPAPRVAAERRPEQPDPASPLAAEPLRDVTPVVLPRRTGRGGALSVAVVLSVMVGWFAFPAVRTAFAGLDSRLVRGSVGDAGRRGVGQVAATQEASPQALLSTEVELGTGSSHQPSGPDPETAHSSIRIFTTRQDAAPIARSTQLCYAVDGAYQARIEPGIGQVAPTSTLSCRRVSPRRTTTYELTAYGRDGGQVSQQLVVLVR